jgi:transcription initiation factor TFIIIB Brf1 subunit/transcription initiation factor TFIIB
MENQKESENKKLECEECGSKFVYVRIKDNQVVCRSCGHISDLKKEE